MKTIGTVVQKLENQRILVEIKRASACGGNCHSCGSCSAGTSQIVAEGEKEIKVGDRVVLETSKNRYFLLSFLVFVCPLCIIFAVYLMLSCFCPETVASLAAVLAGILAFVMIVIALRKLKLPKATLLPNERGNI